MEQITVACLDMAGTTVADDGSVLAAFQAAAAEFGLTPGVPGYAEAVAFVLDTMGQSKIEVFRHSCSAARTGPSAATRCSRRATPSRCAPDW
jgi:phosphoglycolate phosphatase-like HAD superfamily hydrolase